MAEAPKAVVLGVVEKKGRDFHRYGLEELRDLLRAMGINPEKIRDAQQGREDKKKEALFKVLLDAVDAYGAEGGRAQEVYGEWVPAIDAPNRVAYRKWAKGGIAFTGGVGLLFTVLALLDKAAEKNKNQS